MDNKTLAKYIGFTSRLINNIENIISGLGGFLGIAAVYLISSIFISNDGAKFLVVASMGSSAVLLFAVPSSSLTQPWNVFGGHMISALIGVTCAKYINIEVLAAAASVGISISVMGYMKCIHPPAGATTLFAVIGGTQVHALGYAFLLTPLLLNVIAILMIAILFNMPFRWRRYPSCNNNRSLFIKEKKID